MAKVQHRCRACWLHARAACLQILLQVQHMAGAPQAQQYKGLIDILQRLPKEQGGYKALFRGGCSAAGWQCTGWCTCWWLMVHMLVADGAHADG
jgi:hypothetical protein